MRCEVDEVGPVIEARKDLFLVDEARIVYVELYLFRS